MVKVGEGGEILIFPLLPIVRHPVFPAGDLLSLAHHPCSAHVCLTASHSFFLLVSLAPRFQHKD